ncbi:MAG TPA: SDR family oxidoreductase [Bacteroidales bacterium]|nr:SDR family oxidoreductase [Bacteroidales bacterium]
MDEAIHKNGVEIWGGAEYSFVRIGNAVYDQLSASGNETRSGKDLDLYGELGIRTVRYPLLWEKCAAGEENFFSLHDIRLKKLAESGIEPVAGLLHHGSGPFSTSLIEKDFPEKLADYALGIASRYPWIKYYTPVNEPLTTARFSGLYGIWYPHLKDDRSFVRIFLNEIRGIILSMQAIRSVNPDAGLVQTEDLCRVYSTDIMGYQAYFENLRRWLTYDFLLGKVDIFHPMYKYFISNGITDKELQFFRDNREIPEVCGFNYYATSDRFLDHRVSSYPPHLVGGNGFHQYADVEAVRGNIENQVGAYSNLKEAWERYHLPLALTEVHLSCTREEQLRWFYEAWQTGTKLRSEGVDFRAITAWSFFGSFDWSSLLCEKRNDYETGVFDIRSGKPRPTAVAGLIKSISTNENNYANIIKTPGWWARRDRFIFKSDADALKIPQPGNVFEDVKPILISGAGSLGKAIARACQLRGLHHILSDRKDMDISSERAVRNFIEKINPWAIINAAGFSRIDDAENDAYSCFRDNTLGPAILASLCHKEGIKFVTISSDQVFNGKKRIPYSEYDFTNPLNIYGLSKLLAEEKVLKSDPGALIFRSGFFINPWNKADSLASMLISGMRSGNRYYLPSDIIISPSYVPSLVNIVLDLMIDNESGIWHLSGEDEKSYYDIARTTLMMAGLNENMVFPVTSDKLRLAALRPNYSVLKGSSGIVLPAIEKVLENYIYELLQNTINLPVEQSVI